MAEVRPIIPADLAYTRTAIALHWLALLLIACGFALGVWMVNLPIAPRTLRIYAYHKWIGITVFLLTAFRLGGDARIRRRRSRRCPRGSGAPPPRRMRCSTR